MEQLSELVANGIRVLPNPNPRTVLASKFTLVVDHRLPLGQPSQNDVSLARVAIDLSTNICRKRFSLPAVRSPGPSRTPDSPTDIALQLTKHWPGVYQFHLLKCTYLDNSAAINLEEAPGRARAPAIFRHTFLICPRSEDCHWLCIATGPWLPTYSPLKGMPSTVLMVNDIPASELSIVEGVRLAAVTLAIAASRVVSPATLAVANERASVIKRLNCVDELLHDSQLRQGFCPFDV